MVKRFLSASYDWAFVDSGTENKIVVDWLAVIFEIGFNGVLFYGSFVLKIIIKTYIEHVRIDSAVGRFHPSVGIMREHNSGIDANIFKQILIGVTQPDIGVVQNPCTESFVFAIVLFLIGIGRNRDPFCQSELQMAVKEIKIIKYSNGIR